MHHTLSIGALVAFFLYLNRFFAPIQLLVQQYNSFQQGQASILKLRTLLATEPTVTEAPDAVELPPIEGEIVFDDVTFGYDPDVPVIRDVDLRIAPGETVAFVGPTGAGKSTLAKLVTRFYDPTAGRVLIDGHDLEGVTLDSLRRQLGVVPQEPFLFAGTIRDNLAFARPSTSPTPRWPRPSGPVGLAELVDRLPEGVDTVVHERGQSLSSGERQLHRAGPGLPRPPPGARARRGHLQPRPAVRDPDRGRPRRPPRGPHRRAHRPPPVHRHEGGPHRRGRRRAHRRVRRPRRARGRGGRYAEMYEAWINQSEHSADAATT